MLGRAAWTPLLALGPLLLMADPDFLGCTSGPDVPDEPVTLPTSEAPLCTLDEECRADEMCVDIRCVGGSCLVVSATIDRDGDGVSPLPCGDDCDDSDRLRHPGLSEVCDGRDNDCDSLVDDGAPPTNARYSLARGDATAVILPWGPRFLVTEASGFVLSGIPVAADGSVGEPIVLVPLAESGGLSALRAATHPDGRSLFVYLAKGRVLRYVIVERTDTDLARVIEGPSELPLGDLDTYDFEAIAFGESFAIAVDTFDASERVLRRQVWYPHGGAPIYDESAPADGFPPGLALATDGRHLAVTDPAGAVALLAEDGSEVARHPTPNLFGVRPMASGDGVVYVSTQDGADLLITPVTASGGLGEPVPSPVGDPFERFWLLSAGGLVLVAHGDLVVTVQALESDLRTAVGERVILGDAARPVSQLRAAQSESAVGIAAALTGFEPAADLAIVQGCALP